MHELELRRQEFEKRMADDHKSLILQVDAANKEFMKTLDNGNKRVQLILGFVLGGIALFGVLVGVLQLLYPVGFPWLQNVFGIQQPSLPPMPEF